MIGIYKYQNKFNGHIYIGKSIDIDKRQSNHRYSVANENANDYNSQFHQAVRKYKGFDAFDYEVIAIIEPEEYTKEYLNQLEKFFIKYYDSYHNGYNATEGGDDYFGDNSIHKGETNGRALLTEEDVIYIRECYNAHIPFREIYTEYKDKISKRGLQKVWWFDTWKHIYPEYHTEENKYWHSHNAKANSSEIAAQNQRKFTDEQVKEMRKAYDEGMTPKKVWQKYSPESAWSTVYNVITRQTYKDIK